MIMRLLGLRWNNRVGGGGLRPPSSLTTVRTVPYTAVPATLSFLDVNARFLLSTQRFLSDSVRYFPL